MGFDLPKDSKSSSRSTISVSPDMNSDISNLARDISNCQLPKRCKVVKHPSANIHWYKNCFLFRHIPHRPGWLVINVLDKWLYCLPIIDCYTRCAELILLVDIMVSCVRPAHTIRKLTFHRVVKVVRVSKKLSILKSNGMLMFDRWRSYVEVRMKRPVDYKELHC